MNPLVAAWQDAIDSFVATVDQISDESFATPSLLPGWTVGDIVAHVAALEAELCGDPLPDHQPDWNALAHADDAFSRYTELGVDHRRGMSPQALRAELAEVRRRRSSELREGPQGDDDLVRGIAGNTWPLRRVLRMRCFDIFLHEFDVRDALELGVPRIGAAGTVTVGLMADSLGYVWVKKAQALPGQVLHFVVPGYVDQWIGVGEDGRGRAVEATQATTTVSMDVLAFIRLAAGRRPDPHAASVGGDQNLAERVLQGLNVSP